ncbi:Uncharacterized conserved protein (DUF2156) [Micromonospora matsumotoense]|uniref:Uncharacterized conserved protein (DUF2156) n=1 Tax=Micromonospora matsumotoense TaxID=121616 RepID=A0A1C5AWV8_9ACTN|nr:DUF2156 domain-containing protein [Micromonospora matsumotoense]SCF49692.1 Uncharacterized conserved protein (DUF2156) [Micromonospora matsumotoense]
MTETLSPSLRIHESIRRDDVDNPSAFLATNAGNSVFTAPGRDGVVVYRTAGRWLVQFGGVFAAPPDQTPILRAFREFAAARQRRVVAVQLQPADAERYAAQGWTVNQIGGSYAVDLSTFSLAGTRFMRLRNKISRAHRSGLTVHEVDAAEWYDRMRALDRDWLQSKGEHATELEFLVGQYGGEMQPLRRLFVGLIDGELAGYISYSPVYGSRPGWMHDLSRRRPDETPGLMEAINRVAIDRFTAEGVRWLHFGFTPFTALDEALELPGHSPAFRTLMNLLWQYGEAVYPARTQLDYKMKWAPDVVLPEYIAFDGPASVTGFAHVFRACAAF